MTPSQASRPGPSSGPAPGPWLLRMIWEDLCFMHWALPPERLQPTLPPGLTLDTWEGAAYLGTVPFSMSGVAPRGLPAVSGLSDFPELNLRTYVRGPDGVPGVWFYSLDVTQPVAAALARTFYHLPYRHARMWRAREGGVTRYASLHPQGAFAGAYRPTGPEFQAAPGSLEAFLTDRLCLYVSAPGRLYRGWIEHDPWPLRRARAELRVNTLAAPLGLDLLSLGEPHLLHAERLEVRAHWLERLR